MKQNPTTKTVKVYALIKKYKEVKRLNSTIDKMLLNTLEHAPVNEAEKYLKDAAEVKKILNAVASLSQYFGEV